MTLTFDHITVPARNKVDAMTWIAGILGVQPGPVVEPFAVVELGTAPLDYITVAPEDLRSQHIALRVDDEQFDDILGKLVAAGIDYFAEPQNPQDPGQGHVYYANGGRGFYFSDPDGHAMEIKTTRDSFDPDVLAAAYTAPYPPPQPSTARH